MADLAIDQFQLAASDSIEWLGLDNKRWWYKKNKKLMYYNEWNTRARTTSCPRVE